MVHAVSFRSWYLNVMAVRTERGRTTVSAVREEQRQVCVGFFFTLMTEIAKSLAPESRESTEGDNHVGGGDKIVMGWDDLCMTTLLFVKLLV